VRHTWLVVHDTEAVYNSQVVLGVLSTPASPPVPWIPAGPSRQGYHLCHPHPTKWQDKNVIQLGVIGLHNCNNMLGGNKPQLLSIIYWYKPVQVIMLNTKSFQQTRHNSIKIQSHYCIYMHTTLYKYSQHYKSYVAGTRDQPMILALQPSHHGQVDPTDKNFDYKSVMGAWLIFILKVFTCSPRSPGGPGAPAPPWGPYVDQYLCM